MSSIRVPGSVYKRASGRWAAVTSLVFDPQEGRRRRISLGTFPRMNWLFERAAEFLLNTKQKRIAAERLSR